jgi:hypothetical protein
VLLLLNASSFSLPLSSGLLTSGYLLPNATFVVTFPNVGNYTFTDPLHPGDSSSGLPAARGTITVTTPPPPAAPVKEGPVGAGRAFAQLGILLAVLLIIR